VREAQAREGQAYERGEIGPSAMTGPWWVWARNPLPDCQPLTEHSGKWLVFASHEAIDGLWATVHGRRYGDGKGRVSLYYE